MSFSSWVVNAIAICLTVAAAGGCARVDSADESPDAAPTGNAGHGAAGGSLSGRLPVMTDQTPGCTNLQCRQTTCPGAATSLSGVTFAPNGTLPLPNVLVYVPNGELAPFVPEVTCNRCADLVSGQPIAAAISDQQGRFQINNVPTGRDVPLVFQVGRWRRRVLIPAVTACRDNPITDRSLLRLPRNRTEGDLPRIAVTTGACDRLGCLLPKLGIDTGEMGVEGSDAPIVFYKGAEDPSSPSTRADGPDGMTDASSLWRHESELSRYDIVMASCECSEARSNKGSGAWRAMTDYLAKGGRLFGSDFMYVWYRYSPDTALSDALSITGAGPDGHSPLSIDTSQPQGRALADWMGMMDPGAPYGEIGSHEVFDNIAGAVSPAVKVWATSTSARSSGPRPRIFSVDLPAGAPESQRCGRAVHFDAHVAATTDANSATRTSARAAFPNGCGGDSLTATERAAAYLFFNLASCLPSDAGAPSPIPGNVP